MTKQQFRALRLNALDCTDFDQFVAECGGSMPEEYHRDGVDIVSAMRQIWDLAHNFTPKQLFSIYGASLRYISAQYNIPVRTLEQWNVCSHLPPEYVLDLLAADMLTSIMQDS